MILKNVRGTDSRTKLTAGTHDPEWAFHRALTKGRLQLAFPTRRALPAFTAVGRILWAVGRCWDLWEWRGFAVCPSAPVVAQPVSVPLPAVCDVVSALSGIFPELGSCHQDSTI